MALGTCPLYVSWLCSHLKRQETLTTVTAIGLGRVFCEDASLQGEQLAAEGEIYEADFCKAPGSLDYTQMGDSPTSNSFNGSKLDVSLVNVDLGRTLLDLVSGRNPVPSAALDILKWLGREKINDSDYQYCVKQTAGLAYPNEVGLVVKERLLQRTPSKVGGLSLVRPGAVGRWMVMSHEHCYMVTTTLVFARYRGLNYVPRLLCEMFLASENVSETHPSIPESVVRMRLTRVLSKVTDSIALNVMNVGHSVNDFPERLRGHCSNHLTDEKDFAKIAVHLTRNKHQTLLFCERFQADLLLWILNHWK